MKFIDAKHQLFYEKRQCGDVYRDSVSYLLGLTMETRSGAADLFNEDGMVIEGLVQPWQTGTTQKVTRLAYNLWNSCMYESQEDYEDGKVSMRYSVDDIFCTGLAPFFFQAIQIRYPEYFRG